MEPQRKKLKTVHNVVDIHDWSTKCFENPVISENIFRHLRADDKAVAARVCKQWHDIIYKPRMWRHNDLFIDMDAVDMRIMAPSLKRRNITKLKLHSYADSVAERKHVVKQLLYLMRSLGHIIRSLDMEMFCVILDERILVRAFNYKTLSFLETLILSVDFGNQSQLIKVICERCPYLKRLEMPYFDRMTDSSLTLIGQNLTELRELDLGFSSITNTGINLLAQLPLRKLSLCSCNQINEDCIIPLLQFRNSLKCLDISCCFNLDSNVALYRIAKSGLCLTELRIGYYVIPWFDEGGVPDAVNDVAIEFFLWKKAGRRLKRFLIEDLKFSALTGASIVENCPELRVLSMERQNVTDRAKEAFERLKTAPWNGYQQQPHRETRQRSYSL